MLAYSDEFQSTLPARGATHLPLLAPPAWNISIHAPRTGSDARQPGHSGGLRYFNPRSPHGERHCAPFMDMGKSVISIHAPRTGSDADLDGHLPSGGDFNPRSPHGERRSQRLWKEYTTCNFNPRSPHGERRHKPGAPLRDSSISIHAPRTGSDFACSQPVFRHVISIHAPRTGSDFPALSPRPSAWISIHAPRTGSDQPSCRPRRSWHSISIHAPRTGSDKWTAFMSPPRGYFNPRSPHGERPVGESVTFTVTQFQSTLPARGATGRDPLVQAELAISIHAPRTGSDTPAAAHQPAV